MRRIFLLIPIVLVGVSASLAGTHFAVVKSSPAKDQTLQASPKRVQIWFSQAPAEAVSQLKLIGADKAELPLGKTVVDKESKSAYADVPKPLAAGAYTVTWRAAGDDGHVQNGEIKFTIAPK